MTSGPWQPHCPSPVLPHTPVILSFIQFSELTVTLLFWGFGTYCCISLGNLLPFLFWKTPIHPYGLILNVPCLGRSFLTFRFLCCGFLKHTVHLISCLLLLCIYNLLEEWFSSWTLNSLKEDTLSVLFIGKTFMEVKHSKSQCGIWEKHILGNCSREATVRTGHGTTDWFQIGKGVRQGCILSPCLFNFYAEYIMRNAGLDEAQAGIKIAGEISITLSLYSWHIVDIVTSGIQMIPHLRQKTKKN